MWRMILENSYRIIRVLIISCVLCSLFPANVFGRKCDAGTYLVLRYSDSSCEKCDDNFAVRYPNFACEGSLTDVVGGDKDDHYAMFDTHKMGVYPCGANSVPSKDYKKCTSDIACQRSLDPGYYYNPRKQDQVLCTSEVMSKRNLYLPSAENPTTTIIHTEFNNVDNSANFSCPGGNFYVVCSQYMNEDYFVVSGFKACPSGQYAYPDDNYATCHNSETKRSTSNTNNGTSTDHSSDRKNKAIQLVNVKLESATGFVSETNSKIYTAGPLVMSCDAGYVWFNKQCTACNSNVAWYRYATAMRVYCPGGDDLAGKNVIDQVKSCGSGLRPNADLSGCDCIYGQKDTQTCKLRKIPKSQCNICTNIALTKEDLYYGPDGKNAPFYKQCWTKTDAVSYRKCMGF